MGATTFREAFAPVISFKDGFYYNIDGVRYTRHGDPGGYTYEESASISVQDSVERPVSPAEVDVMVTKAYEATVGCTM